MVPDNEERHLEMEELMQMMLETGWR